MKVHLSRHAQAQHNVDGVFAGNALLSKLTEEGRQEAQVRGEKLSETHHIDLIVYSYLTRSQETAEIITQAYRNKEKTIPGMATELLNEVDEGLFSGKTPAEARIINNHALEVFLEGKEEDWAFPEGESGLDLGKRAEEFLAFLATHPHQEVLVVGHSLFNRFILKQVGILPPVEWGHEMIVSFDLS